ncbi:sensor histidine kinase YesM [Pedobacter sp. CAN_A7]|uniref:sensor histidine kinase n=1 Tax=Pedobacter sp. CAN_A7 TaxID=2787722 RepID=UPI0018CB4F19
MTIYQRIFRTIYSIDFIAIIALIIGFFFPLTRDVEMPAVFWIKQLIEYTLYVIFYFGNVHFLFPKLANKKYGFLYFIVLCLLIYLVPIVLRWVRNITDLYPALTDVYASAGYPYRPSDHWDTTVVIAILTIVLAGSYFSAMAKKMHKNELAYEASERERISAELSFLKAQINPHFFFNTLHTIYALMDTDQPAAKSSIYNLSHMMRYVLYDTKNDRTSLNKEIGFIEDYIALMKVRISDEVQIIVDKQTPMSDMKIVPMLLLPFIENAFKHGISAIEPSYIFIGIAMTDTEFIFEVRNSLFEDLGKQLDADQGIGIANTRRRLDLLYAGKYSLDIESDTFAKEYSITLTILK